MGSGIIQSILERPTSEHFLIMLESGKTRRGPMPFRFENMWLKATAFKEMMQV